MSEIVVIITESVSRRVALDASEWAAMLGVRGTPQEVAEFIADQQPIEVENHVLSVARPQDSGADDEWYVAIGGREVHG